MLQLDSALAWLCIGLGEMMPTGYSLRLVLCILLAAELVGCRDKIWQVNERTRALDSDVAAALGDTSTDNSGDLVAEDVPEIQYPRSLRPCCAFGGDLKVAVGRVPVPGVEIGNLVGPDAIGAHRYDNGYLSLQRGDPRGLVDDEKNGLIYTCRGGFIDLAHVRDNADNTLALAAAIARSLEQGGTIEIPPQGAIMRVRTRPVSAAAIAKFGRVPLSVALAEWVAFQLSAWHEIATYYGYASLAQWPEKISAFSPEDLYSNEIGVRIAGGVISSRGARSDIEYGLNMDAWIRRMLERLEAVPLSDSQAAMRAVDGAWWDSEKRIPDWTLVKRRQFSTGPFLRPWLLEDASPGSKGVVKALSRCKKADPPLVLHILDGFSGAYFRDYATVEFEVSDLLVDSGFPLPRPDDRIVTQADFPTIIAVTRAKTVEALGPGADAP
jgi:hypothetical protein